MRFVLVTWLALAAGLSGVYGDGPIAEPLPNTMCPVDPGEAAEADISVLHEGRRVYFCCNRCRRKFVEDPSAYRAGLPPLASHGEPVLPQDHGGVHPPSSLSGDVRPGAVEAAGVDGHDHVRDHGADIASPVSRTVRWAGKFHPLAVHFPIALIAAALLAEMLAWARPRAGWGVIARFCITLGAVGAIAAAPLGWMSASFYGAEELARVLFWHRWLGAGVVVLSSAAAVLCHLSQTRARLQRAYRGVLVAAAAAVALAGHLGATLVYGADYFTW